MHVLRDHTDNEQPLYLCRLEASDETDPFWHREIYSSDCDLEK